jgi:DNA polymerase-3 subunit beta
MEVFLSISFPAKGEGHPAVLVDRDLFRSALKDTQSITLADGGCSTPAVSLSTVTADDYPLFPETHSAAGDPAVMAYFTKAGLAFAAAAASTDSTKPAMSSVRMELEAGKAGVTLVTTDGFRLATGSFCGTVPAKSGAFLLPARLVSILSALIEDGAPVGIRMGERHVTFQGANWVLTTQVVEGKFPPYRGAVPAEDRIPHTFKVLDRVAFKKSLAMVAAKTDDYNRDLSLEVNGITGCLVVDHPDTGKATAEFPCQADAPVAPGLKFNVDYLQSLVDRAQDAVMVFRFGAQGTPWLFEELLGHGVNAKALLMPFIPAGPKGGVEPPAEVEVAEAIPDPTPTPEAPSQEEGALEAVVAAAAPDAEIAQIPAVEPPPAEESDTIAVWRQDAKAVRALGGREALQAAKYKVKWEMKQSHGFTSYQPLCWFVPKSILAELGITPISEAEAMEIFRARSAKAKAAHAA